MAGVSHGYPRVASRHSATPLGETASLLETYCVHTGQVSAVRGLTGCVPLSAKTIIKENFLSTLKQVEARFTIVTEVTPGDRECHGVTVLCSPRMLAPSHLVRSSPLWPARKTDRAQWTLFTASYLGA